MRKGYSLTAEALLYSVVLKKKAGIFGVENVLAGMGEDAYPEFVRRAEEELADSGAGELDFGGGLSLTEEFDGLMDLCTDCAGVVAVDLRDEEGLRHVTFYLGDGQVPVLVKKGEGYTLYPEAQAAEVLEEFLQLPENKLQFASCRLESGKAAKTKARDLTAQGLNEEDAAFLAEALSGGHCFCQVSRTEGFEKNALLPFVYSPRGCAEILTEYDADKEYLVFEAVDGRELLERMEGMLREGMDTSFDENEYDGIEYLPEEETAIESGEASEEGMATEKDEAVTEGDEASEEGGE